MKSVSHKLRTGVLELRTDRGALYAAPSFYERLYLLWIFRNFHSLGRPVLSQRQQKLVDNLAARAETLERDALHRPCVIGTIENLGKLPVRKPQTAVSATKLIELPAPKPNPAIAPAVGSELVAFPRKHSTPRRRGAEPSDKPNARVAEIVPAAKPVPRDNTARSENRARGLQNQACTRLVSGAVSIAGLLGVLFYLSQARTPLTRAGFKADVALRAESNSPAQVQRSQESPPAISAPILEVKASPGDAIVPVPKKSEPSTRPKVELPKASATDVDSSSTLRVQIPGAPDHGLTYPETPDPNLTGVVNLRALIAPDGSVTDVTVLNGKRALGVAAARAVRHWRYRPPESNGQAVEAETKITFTFLGDDAVSVSFSPSPEQKRN